MKLSEIFIKLKQSDKPKDSEIAAAINELFDASQRDYSRIMQERVWYRNVLFYIDEQYVEYIRSLNTFRRKILPDYMPTPVSNQVKDYVRAVKARLLNQKLIPKVAPNTNEQQDIEAAQLAEELLEDLDRMNNNAFYRVKEKTAIGVPIFGTTFIRTYPCMNNDQWIFDASGNPIKMGEVGVEDITPFQVQVDNLGVSLDKKRWIGIQSLKPREWVEDIFKIPVKQNSNILATDYMKRLMKMVSQVSPWKGAGIDPGSFSHDDDSLVLFRELEMKPTIKYPNGRYFICCGDTLLKKYERLPVKTENGYWNYSLTDFHMDYIPGGFWSHPGVNSIISPQITINEIDQALAINRKGVARPTMFVPGEISIKKVDTVGTLGVGMLVIGYDSLLSGGKAPTIQQGKALPQQVIEERILCLKTIQDSGGDPKNVMRGDVPGSHTSGILFETMRETVQAGSAPDLTRWQESITGVQKKKLLIAQEIMTEERIIKTRGKGNVFRAKIFKSADLRGNTDLRMELDSGMATTNAGKMQILMDAAQAGLLGPIDQNPELRQEFLRRMGLSGFTEQENPDAKRAERENAMVAVGMFDEIMLSHPDPKQGGAITPDSEIEIFDPLFKYDDHKVHYEIHRRKIVDPEFKAWGKRMQTVLISHADQHNMMNQMAMEAMKADALVVELQKHKMEMDLKNKDLQGKEIDNRSKEVVNIQKLQMLRGKENETTKKQPNTEG